MARIGEMIAASSDLGLMYAEKLLADADAGSFGAFARPGGQVVQSNHPAFILGHLSLYPSRVIADLGEDPGAHQPSDKYMELFSFKATCVDDPDNSIYPAKDEIVAKFYDGYRRAGEVLRAADEALFQKENPNEGMRGKFPTIGAMHGFYVSGHVMMHLGQLSAWRRAMGSAPA